MNLVFKKSLASAFVVVAVTIKGVSVMAESSPRQPDLAGIFEAVRKGDSSQTGQLAKPGTTGVSALVPYLSDANAAVRREAVNVTAAIGGREAAEILLTRLDDSEEEVRERAANAVLRFVLKTGDTTLSGFEQAVTGGSQIGKPSAAALLLLGYAKGADKVLLAALSDDRLVKLPPGGPVVEAKIAAALAASRRGEQTGRALAVSAIQAAELNTIIFMLDVIEAIDAPGLLHELANKALADDRGWSGGIPSGQTHQPLRVKDMAVGAFVRRLKLKPGFEVNNHTKYEDGQIESVRKLIASAIPQ